MDRRVCREKAAAVLLFLSYFVVYLSCVFCLLLRVVN